MEHRHLNHERLTLAAIDDIIGRGKHTDWIALRRAAQQDPAVTERILRVCAERTSDPYAQRYHFWRYYAEDRLT